MRKVHICQPSSDRSDSASIPESLGEGVDVGLRDRLWLLLGPRLPGAAEERPPARFLIATSCSSAA